MTFISAGFRVRISCRCAEVPDCPRDSATARSDTPISHGVFFIDIFPSSKDHQQQLVEQQLPECPQVELPPGVRTTVWMPRSQVEPAQLVNESRLLFCALMSF